jgi:hypothetical protein
VWWWGLVGLGGEVHSFSYEHHPKWLEMLHNGGFCYITVDSARNTLQNGAARYQCISKQMHYKTSFSYNGYLKSLEFYVNYITLFCLTKKKTF